MRPILIKNARNLCECIYLEEKMQFGVSFIIFLCFLEKICMFEALLLFLSMVCHVCLLMAWCCIEKACKHEQEH